jgi:YidC/Oxa1 family membrane protein insertase
MQAQPVVRFTRGEEDYQLADGQDQLVVDLKFSKDGVNYIKRFTLKRGLYDLTVSYLIDNQSASLERQCSPSSSAMPAPIRRRAPPPAPRLTWALPCGQVPSRTRKCR